MELKDALRSFSIRNTQANGGPFLFIDLIPERCVYIFLLILFLMASQDAFIHGSFTAKHKNYKQPRRSLLVRRLVVIS